MPAVTGGAVVASALRALGVRQVFAVASVHNLPILNAIRHSDAIDIVNTRHEQAAVHAADGYARVTGDLGVALVSTGPGAANAMGGLFEAGFASSRVLVISGQVETRYLGQGRGYLHEAERQRSMLRSLTRETWSVQRGCDVADAVLDAAAAVLRGRPQPCAVEIPIDLQYASVVIGMLEPRHVASEAPDSERVSAAAELLASARRPLIWAGGGVNHAGASSELRQLVDRLSIPVVTSTEGRGALPEDHDLCLGAIATEEPLRQVVQSADVVLAIGTRFQMYPTGFWTLRLPPSLIHLDADASVIGRTYSPLVSLRGDARVGLQMLGERLTSTGATPEWAKEARTAADKARASAIARLGVDHRGILASIRRHLPVDGVIVRDSTVPAYAWGDRLLPILASRTSIRPVSAAIGPGLPLAIGAAAASGTRTVVLHGDGGIMLSIGELATLSQTRLPVTVCVFNDRGYGVLRSIEAATFDGEQHDVDLLTPDFVVLAQAVGLEATRVSNATEFDAAFRRAATSSEPNLIEVDLTAIEPMDYPIGRDRLVG